MSLLAGHGPMTPCSFACAPVQGQKSKLVCRRADVGALFHLWLFFLHPRAHPGEACRRCTPPAALPALGRLLCAYAGLSSPACDGVRHGPPALARCLFARAQPEPSPRGPPLCSQPQPLQTCLTCSDLCCSHLQPQRAMLLSPQMKGKSLCVLSALTPRWPLAFLARRFLASAVWP